MLFANPLIAADNTWGLMCVMCLSVAFSIWLEQKYKWASKVSGAIIALILWGGIHGAFVKPYLLVSVMRRYIEAGRTSTPQIDVYEKLTGMSKGFRKALDRAQGEAAPAA